MWNVQACFSGFPKVALVAYGSGGKREGSIAQAVAIAESFHPPSHAKQCAEVFPIPAYGGTSESQLLAKSSPSPCPAEWQPFLAVPRANDQNSSWRRATND